ncbi:hypothetical protein BpHYR1_031336 [Brachionus plicatilis]|uniref:Uncharacterized protein n=1 Tax=Brachionus plicatilis TaxID=10195 RepID=A0A3M7SYY6_BRAPC|nr:hypothetical protein BpHYR1_031336 [Brachionus plicatilis]
MSSSLRCLIHRIHRISNPQTVLNSVTEFCVELCLLRLQVNLEDWGITHRLPFPVVRLTIPLQEKGFVIFSTK